MRIPLYYSWRNLLTRRLTTFLTAGGMALVVFVFAAVMMLSTGLETTLIETGSDHNLIATRKGAGSEMQSGIDRSQAALLEVQPEIAISPEGKPLVTKELVVPIGLIKRGTSKPSNVVIRGISPQSLQLRNQIRLQSGRMPRPGSTEIVVGSSIAKRFSGVQIGDSLRFALRDWQVVGIFDAGATGFSSEVWGDVEQIMQAFRRPHFSSVTFRLAGNHSFTSLKSRIESEPRLTVELRRETRYYRDQSEAMATFIRILGMTLTVIFSLGAVIGALITMSTAVANRVAEIGTLRAIGFQRSGILVAFLAESFLLGFLGGISGIVLASFLQLITISTMNWQTFSELAFSFTLTFEIIVKSLLFSVVMGLVGGIIPALKASRLQIIDALRAG